MKRLFWIWLCWHSVQAAEPQVLVHQFIQKMLIEHQFNEAELKKTLAQAQRREDILRKISRPAEKRLNWGQYRKIFLTSKRVQQGVRFWRQNQAALKKAQEVYGVPPQFIVAIIGVETFYGRITGKDRVLDALYTLAFYYPKRSPFFTSELEHYLLLIREEGMDPAQPKGSYAGAMGLGQFMPSSYRRYAVDFDGDGHRDIWQNPTDAIGSVAHYFYAHGWQEGQPVVIPVKGVDAQKHAAFLTGQLKPQFSLAQLRQAGIIIDDQYKDDLLASLIEYETEKGKEYWLGFNNFYVISRYNHSKLYAMAVYQLSERIKQAYEN